MWKSLLLASLAWGNSIDVRAAAAPDFGREVAPIFRKYCSGCHNAKDLDGEFSLESHAALMKGGESGPALVAGQPDQSLLLKLMEGREKPHMPPRKEPQPTSEEVGLIRAWIQAGAPGPVQGMELPPTLPQVKPRPGIRQPLTALALHPDGKHMALARYQRVEWVRMADKKVLRAWENVPGKVNSLSVSGDGKWLVAATGMAGRQGRAVLWRLDDDFKQLEVGDGHLDQLFDAVISPKGDLLATAGYDSVIKLWSLPEGRFLRDLKAHNGAIFDLAFDPAGIRLASAGADETVKLWRVSDGIRLDTLNQPEGEQFTVTFTPDGHHLLAAGADHRIRMWSLLPTDQPRIQPLIHSRFAHEEDIQNLAVHPAGTWLISASADRSLKVWSLPTLEQMQALPGPGDLVAAMAFHPREPRLALAVMDGQLDWLSTKDWKPTVDAPAPQSGEGTSMAHRDTQGKALQEGMESEPNDEVKVAQPWSLPARMTGAMSKPGDRDLYRFEAHQGEEWVFEVEAARTDSKLDSHLAVLDAQGQPILQQKLRALRNSWLTFRGKDSATSADFRLHNWREMELNEYLFVNGEVVKLYLYPRGPDSGFLVYPGTGNRRTYFGTTAKAHPLGQNCYIVEPVPPQQAVRPNGLPVFDIYFENDDESNQRWGRDSQLFFTAPRDGVYHLQVRDIRGEGGEGYPYKLTGRPRQPDFKVSLAGKGATLNAGGGKEFELKVERIDGFEGEIRVEAENIPEGMILSAPIVVEAGHSMAQGVMYATPDMAPGKLKASPKLTAHARIRGREVMREVGDLGTIQIAAPAKVGLVVLPDGASGHPRLDEQGRVMEITLRPGETITAMVQAERRGFDARIELGKEFAGRNFPHGAYVDNIGLNGLLIVESQSERKFFITTAPWMPDSSRWVHLESNADGKQCTPPFLLHIRGDKSAALP